MLHELHKRVRAGEVLVGTWLFLGDPGVAEIVATSGYDFVVIDMEHSPTDFGGLRPMLMAVEPHCAAVVRVKANTPAAIAAALDLGAAAIIVPHINSGTEAALAVDAAKYRPLGNRGIGPYRASGYMRDADRFFVEANDKQMVWLQLEHREALENLNEIVRVDGVDAFFIGLADLSQSLGHLGNPQHPEVAEATQAIVETLQRAGRPVGSAFSSPRDAAPWRKAGLTIFTVAADFRFVANGAAETLAAAHEVLGAGS